ncbi:unnamed protein product [Meloidogyne enterolobii]|uniref:Uncharacterized protein n=1 Tax=Meloidogyne enterolobii TaxID=390850 RepID=A0ACB0ZPA8_MELEN
MLNKIGFEISILGNLKRLRWIYIDRFECFLLVPFPDSGLVHHKDDYAYGNEIVLDDFDIIRHVSKNIVSQ